jgi:ectoine hydroxylase-related dioxygenase (phytanoyl-CoA dioxygenase family)
MTIIASYAAWTEQIRIQGFALVPRFVSEEGIATLLGALSRESLQRSRAGVRNALRYAPISSMANHPHMIQAASDILGKTALPYRATLFDKNPTANWSVVWHQDTALPLKQRVELPGWGPWSVKKGTLYALAPRNVLEKVVALRLHLDDCTHENGPLRVLPGTHERGVLCEPDIWRLASDIRPIECIAMRGGLLAMRPLLVHASSKPSTAQSRRVLHVEYGTSLQLEGGLELAIA